MVRLYWGVRCAPLFKPHAIATYRTQPNLNATTLLSRISYPEYWFYRYPDFLNLILDIYLPLAVTRCDTIVHLGLGVTGHFARHIADTCASVVGIHRPSACGHKIVVVNEFGGEAALQVVDGSTMRGPLPRPGVCSLRLVVALIALTLGVKAADSEYQVGVGRADVTGPAADVNMMVRDEALCLSVSAEWWRLVSIGIPKLV
eukprot:5754134-Pyramimonas_sp.AAC.1